METSIEKLYKVIDLQNKAFKNLQESVDHIWSALSNQLSKVTLESWWLSALSRSQEDFEKLLMMLTGGASMPGSIESNIVRLQNTYKKIKNSDLKIKELLTAEEGKIQHIIPSNTALSKFLKGKEKGRCSQNDLEHHVYLLIWTKLTLFPHLKELVKDDENKMLKEQIDDAFMFFSKNMEPSQENIYDVMLRLDNFLHSPEGFLYLYKPISPEAMALCNLLMADKLIKFSFTEQDLVDVVRHSAEVLGVPGFNQPNDKYSCQETIDTVVRHLFHGLSTADSRVEKLYSDLSSLTDADFKQKSNFYFLEKFPYFFYLRKNLFKAIIHNYTQELHIMFAYMNAGLLGVDNRVVVNIFSHLPFNSVIQKEYDSFCMQHNGQCLPFEFAYVIKRTLLSGDFKWDSSRDPSCFNIPWNRFKIQKLYDYLLKTYIDRNTDIRDFCHALTGCKLNLSSWEFKKINWTHKEKQSLALFIGELMKQNQTGKRWSNIPKVFIYKGVDLDFHSSTPFHQAYKSGKYTDIINVIEECTRLKVSKEQLL